MSASECGVHGNGREFDEGRVFLRCEHLLHLWVAQYENHHDQPEPCYEVVCGAMGHGNILTGRFGNNKALADEVYAEDCLAMERPGNQGK